MKKDIFLLVTFLLSIGFSNAQPVKLGLKADLNFFRVQGDGMTRQFHPGVSGGFFAGFQLNDRWSLEPAFLYTQRNTKASDFSKYFSGSASISASRDIFLSWLSLPLLVKYKLPDNLSIEAGIQYNYLINADENLLKDGAGVFKKNDFGLVAGAAYSVSKRLDFYGQFYYGFNDINNVNVIHDWNVQQFQAGAAYTLFAHR